MKPTKTTTISSKKEVMRTSMKKEGEKQKQSDWMEIFENIILNTSNNHGTIIVTN